MMIEQLAEEIINGRRLTRNDDLNFLLNGELQELQTAANRIREKCCGNYVDLCSIINARSGRCSEDCKFCAQSAFHKTGVDEYPFLNEETIVQDCKKHRDEGITHYSLVTSGRKLSDEDFVKNTSAFRRLHHEFPEMKLCGSLGLLTLEQLKLLRENGVTTYHCNLETSRRFFSQVCTTHTFDEKIQTIKWAQCVGLHICSGGIFGLGETWEDRVDMALELSELGVDSIPINALTPIAGTKLENARRLTEDDILRIVIIFRFVHPTAFVRLAAGRIMMKENGKAAFFSGANASITGNMLTTSGNSIAEDRGMLTASGFSV